MAAVGAMKTISNPNLIVKKLAKSQKSRTPPFATLVQRPAFAGQPFHGFSTVPKQENASPLSMVVVEAIILEEQLPDRA